MPLKLANNAVSRLSTSLSAGSTTLGVMPGDGAKFPALSAGDWCPLTIIKADGTLEIVKATELTVDTFTIVRAQEGTAATDFAAGDRIELRLTKAVINDIEQRITDSKVQVDRAILSFPDYAAASAAAATLPDGQEVEASQDETRAGARTRYKVQTGALVFGANLDQTKLDLAASTGASMVGFQHSGSDTIPRDVQQKLRELAKTPADVGLSVGGTTNVPVDLSFVAETETFVDNLRQFNHHTSGATTGEHNIVIPDNKFRIGEVSRSIDAAIGPLGKVLFVGDSLTAWNADDGSYTHKVSLDLALRAGGIKEPGYLAIESTSISAKQQFYGMSLTHSGFTPFETSGLPYTDTRRVYSPDGKGFTVTGADGLRLIRLAMNSSSLVNYTKYKLYYLRQPGGGTFNLYNRGATKNLINTDGALSLQTVEFAFVDNGSPLNKDIWIEDVTGDVTVYGVELIDEGRAGGYSWDVAAISGGALSELMALTASSLQTLATARGYDTVVINIGTNDSSQGRTVEQFSADLVGYVSRISEVLPNAKFVIVSPNNMQWTNFTGSTRAAFEDERRRLCRVNGWMYVDVTSEIGNYNYAVTMGWMRDGTHPNIIGQGVIGASIAPRLIKNARSPAYLAQADAALRYEEGSFFPTLEGITGAGTGWGYSVRAASYTRIGRTVFVCGRITLSAVSADATGQIAIGGLPFAVKNANNFQSAASISNVLNMGVNVVEVTGSAQLNAARILLHKRTAATTSASSVILSDIAATTSFNFSLVYVAA